MFAVPILLVLLTISIINDVKTRRIPNALICIGTLAGFLLSYLNLNGDITLYDSVLGSLSGLLMLLPGYLLGKMGAGDVKLLAMCGGFLGVQATIMAGLCALLAGGFFALIWLFLVKRMSIKDNRYPYAPAIAMGAVLAPYLQFS